MLVLNKSEFENYYGAHAALFQSELAALKIINGLPRLSARRQYYCIYMWQGRPLGFCRVQRLPVAVMAAAHIEIEEFCIFHAYRDRGHCKKFMHALAVHFPGALLLSVLPGNTRAVRCYRSCGFTPIANGYLDSYWQAITRSELVHMQLNQERA